MEMKIELISKEQCSIGYTYKALCGIYIYICIICLPQLYKHTYILWLARLKSVSTYIGLTMPWELSIDLLIRMVFLYTIQSLKLGHLTIDDISHLLHSIVTKMCICLGRTDFATQNALFIYTSWDISQTITVSLSVNVKLFVSVSLVVSIERWLLSKYTLIVRLYTVHAKEAMERGRPPLPRVIRRGAHLWLCTDDSGSYYFPVAFINRVVATTTKLQMVL